MTFVIMGAPGHLNLTSAPASNDFKTSFRPRRTRSANAMVTTLRYHRRLEGSAPTSRNWTQATACARPPESWAAISPTPVTWPTRTTLTAWSRSQHHGRPHGRADHRPRAAVRALRAGQQHHAARLEQVRTRPAGRQPRGPQLASSIGTGCSTFLRYRRNMGPGTNRRCCGIRLGWASGRTGFSPLWHFPVREGHIEPVFMVGMNY